MIVAVTLEKAKRYLRVDYNDEDEDIQDYIGLSQIYMDSMVGEAYKKDEKAVKLSELLQKKFIADMYENRSTEISQNTKQDRIVVNIIDKLSNYVEPV
jgi:uncharacterized phage protein (predicted DNA packaging)